VTLTRRDVVALLERHGLSPSRARGQNFVVDPNTVRRVARLASVGPGDNVVEIGAGLGSLTLALVDTGASVTAIEVDHGLVRALRETTEGRAVQIVEADALALDWTTVLAAAPRWVLVANLPYNVATPLVGDLLDAVPAIERMVVMVQREVADRLVAPARSEAYGAVSVKVAYWATAKIVAKVPASVFLPQPKVESALVEITRRATPAVDPTWVTADELFALVRAGFGQRRKMLRRSLVGLVTPEMFEAAGVRPEARAEELDVHEWGALARARRDSPA
jgi:16S rRNA (adenine1518-N6/adenine1519-N6)-dimethyltransferase